MESSSPKDKHSPSALIPNLKSSFLVTIVLCKNLNGNSLNFIFLQFVLTDLKISRYKFKQSKPIKVAGLNFVRSILT